VVEVAGMDFVVADVPRIKLIKIRLNYNYFKA